MSRRKRLERGSSFIETRLAKRTGSDPKGRFRRAVRVMPLRRGPNDAAAVLAAFSRRWSHPPSLCSEEHLRRRDPAPACHSRQRRTASMKSEPTRHLRQEAGEPRQHGHRLPTRSRRSLYLVPIEVRHAGLIGVAVRHAGLPQAEEGRHDKLHRESTEHGQRRHAGQHQT